MNLNHNFSSSDIFKASIVFNYWQLWTWCLKSQPESFRKKYSLVLIYFREMFKFEAVGPCFLKQVLIFANFPPRFHGFRRYSRDIKIKK